MTDAQEIETTIRPEVLIVGAGFSGLVAARQFVKRGFEVQVIERHRNPGGLISTKKIPAAQGEWLVETAANGLLNSPLVEDLFQEIGVEQIFTKQESKRRYFWVNGRLSRWPLNFLESLRALGGVIAFKWKAPFKEESLSSWASRVFGDAFDKKIVRTGTLGIFAASANKLSANLIVGRFYRGSAGASRKRRYRRGTTAPRLGMGALIEGLERFLKAKGVTFTYETDGTDLILEGLAAGKRVVIATSAFEAQNILSRLLESRRLTAHISETVSRLNAAMSTVETRDLISVGVLFPSPPETTGFGALLSQEPDVGGVDDGVLGVLQNGCIFPGRVAEGRHSETWILGDDPNRRRFSDLDDQALVKHVLEKRRKVFSRSESHPLETVITRWRNAIPLYDIRLEVAQEVIRAETGALLLFGNYVGSLGLQSILEQVDQLVERSVEMYSSETSDSESVRER